MKCLMKKSSSHVRLSVSKRDAVRQVLGRGELRAAALQCRDQGHGLPVECGVLSGGRGAEMRMEGDVAKILGRKNPEIVPRARGPRGSARATGRRTRHVHERQRLDSKPVACKRQHKGSASGRRTGNTRSEGLR